MYFCWLSPDLSKFTSGVYEILFPKLPHFTVSVWQVSCLADSAPRCRLIDSWLVNIYLDSRFWCVFVYLMHCQNTFHDYVSASKVQCVQTVPLKMGWLVSELYHSLRLALLMYTKQTVWIHSTLLFLVLKVKIVVVSALRQSLIDSWVEQGERTKIHFSLC